MSPPNLVVSYCLLFLAALMFIRMHIRVDVASEVAVQDYLPLCSEFVASQWALEISRFCERHAPKFGNIISSGNQEERLRREIVDFLGWLYRCKKDNFTFALSRMVRALVVGDDLEKVRSKWRPRVLVVVDEMADVQTFLRVATKSSGPKKVITLSVAAGAADDENLHDQQRLQALMSTGLGGPELKMDVTLDPNLPRDMGSTPTSLFESHNRGNGTPQLHVV